MIKNYIEQAFSEDRPDGDVTTSSLDIQNRFGVAQLIAKQDLVVSGQDYFQTSLEYCDKTLELEWFFKDGDSVLKGQSICQIQGNLVQLIQAERVALNFLGYFSGIATQTAKYVDACKGTKTKILDTRKTLPLYREASKKAVRHGGGFNHRMNLSEAAMIKENHARLFGDFSECIAKVRDNTDVFLEVEVTNLDELKMALQHDIQRVLLDNMTNEQMAECLQIIPPQIESEASGNMTLKRIPEVAKLGLDFISVGALTHSVPNADFSLLFDWED